MAFIEANKIVSLGRLGSDFKCGYRNYRNERHIKKAFIMKNTQPKP